MESKVLEKIVLVDGENVCMCDTQFYKTCVARIAGNLSCSEAVVRITPIVRDTGLSEDGSFTVAKTLDKELSNIKNALSQTLSHIEKMRR